MSWKHGKNGGLGALLSLPVEERAEYIARIPEDTWTPAGARGKKEKTPVGN